MRQMLKQCAAPQSFNKVPVSFNYLYNYIMTAQSSEKNKLKPWIHDC